MPQLLACRHSAELYLNWQSVVLKLSVFIVDKQKHPVTRKKTFNKPHIKTAAVSPTERYHSAPSECSPVTAAQTGGCWRRDTVVLAGANDISNVCVKITHYSFYS